MFLSRRYRPNKWPYYGLFGIEFCLTVGLLAMAGIAQPNTYRTKLWQDGADNGFNSSPLTGLYAAANYQPYTTPKVWSQFITDYNVVIVVFSMFLMLIKAVMYMLHVFPPILSVFVHGGLIALYTVSVYYQGSSDNTDPDHRSNGPVWYITKSCSVTRNKLYLTYCKQAKATFALTVACLGIFLIYFAFAVWSCIPSKVQKQEYLERKLARKNKWAKLEAMHEEAKREGRVEGMVPETPGPQSGLNPMTPRTMAFNTLGGTKDLPLRNHFSSPNRPTSPNYNLRSPGLPRSPLAMGFDTQQTQVQPQQQQQRLGGESSGVPREETIQRDTPKLYFPPPPKQSSKKK